MVLRVGIDDTDSPKGGCTTFVLTELLALARDHGLDVVGAPRLVRLNPNIPWKTRGNAALALSVGRGLGRPRQVGEVGGRTVRAFRRGRGVSEAVEARYLTDAWDRILACADPDEAATDPAMVAVRRPLPARLYWTAVREVVDPALLRPELERQGAEIRTHGSDRGIVGAAAAIAWPGTHATWEAISYRSASLYGTARQVDAASVRAAQARERGLFLCFDRTTRRLLVAPHTPCPILFGLRGRTAAAVLRSRPRVLSEPVERWMLFRTNQGTGDHLVRRVPAAWPNLRSGWFEGRLVGRPEPRRGGHVAFALAPSDGGPPAACIAFEPTKSLPALARQLVEGDLLRVWGSRGDTPAIRVEGIEVRRWSRFGAPTGPPTCATCGRRARSMGRARGYRCPRCRRRWPPEAAPRTRRVPPGGVGTVHPTASARRHLAPLGPET